MKRVGSSIFVVVLSLGSTLAGRADEPRGPKPAALSASDVLGQLPLYFVPNAGQADSRVRFAVDAREGQFAFRDRGFELRIRGGSPIRFAYTGARARHPHGTILAGGKINFLLGERSRWRTDVPTYREIEYRSLYEGIDVTYAARGTRLESVYRLEPGAAASQIRIRCNGAKALRVDADGKLIVSGGGGEISQSRPRAYQDAGDGRREIPIRYRLDADRNGYGFRIEGPYDPHLPLVIDPILGVSTYLGGSDMDAANAIAADASGQTYIVGSTLSTNFPTLSPASGTAGGRGDAFVTKISSGGTQLVYSTYLGGNDRDVALAVAVDASGQVYVTGSTLSTNFPFGPGFRSSNAGGTDGFVTKLSASGGLVYSTYLGGAGLDVGTAIAVDTVGAAYVAGRTSSSDFPTKGPYQAGLRGVQDAFLAKLGTSGQDLVYGTYLGGSDVDGANGVAVNLGGEAHVTGFTDSINFPTASAYQRTAGGNRDAFVTRFSADGATTLYSTYLGGSEDDVANAIVLDSGGSAYVAGYTRSTDFPLSGAYQTTNRGGLDAFVARLASSGATLSLSTYLGGSGQDEAFAIARDSDGAIYIAGTTSSIDFPVANGLKSTLSGENDVFVAQFSTDNRSLQFSTYFGGSAADSAFGMAVDAAKKIYVTGQTRSQDLQTVSARQTTFGGGLTDAFFFRIDPFEPNFVSTLYFPRLVTTTGTATTFDGSEYTGVAIVNLSGNTATLKFSAYDTTGALVGGTGIANPIQFTLSARNQLARVDTEVFGSGLTARRPVGWFRLDSTAAETLGFFLVFNGTLTVLDGADVSARTLTAFDFPEIEETANTGFTQIHIPNPNTASASATLELVRSDGTVAATATRTIAAGGTLSESVVQLFPSITTFDGGMYIRGTATRAVAAFEYLGKAGQYVEGLNAQDPSLGAKVVYSPQYAVGGGWRTTVSIVNFENRQTTLLLRLIDDNGLVIGTRTQDIAPNGKVQISAQNFFVAPNPQLITQGYLEITSDRANIGGSVVFGDSGRSSFSAALPLLAKTQTSAVFSQVAKDATYYTGLAVLNPSEANASFTVEVLDKTGAVVGSRSETLAGKRRRSRLLTEYFPTLPDLTAGYFRVTSDQGLLSFALFGASSVLSAIPPQSVP